MTNKLKKELKEAGIRFLALILFSIILAFIFDFINPCGFTILNMFKCLK